MIPTSHPLQDLLEATIPMAAAAMPDKLWAS
jgi:hypothetical protein